MVKLRPVPKAGRSLSTPGRNLHAERKKLYGHRWRVERLQHLKASPFCVFCLKRHMHVAATVVDHIVPHDGNHFLFWNRTNWQSLCDTCHSSTKQKLEWADRGGNF